MSNKVNLSDVSPDKVLPHVFSPADQIEKSNENFLRDYGQFAVVSEKDELASIIKYDKCANVPNDITCLMNAKRLENLDPKFVADLVRRRFAERNVSDSVFSGLDDDGIFNMIKSRHIQSLGELDRYSEFLASRIDFTSKQQAALEEPPSEESKSE